MFLIQEPTSRSTTTGAFIYLSKLIIAKYLKQEVDDDLSICVDECSPCGLSMTGDIKIYQCHISKGNDVTIPNGEVHYGLLLPKFDTSSPCG